MSPIIAKLSLAIALFLSIAATPAVAAQLSGPEIQSTIGGKQVMLKTNWGGFPLRYASGGRVTGDGTALGLARFFAPKETGKWWVSGNKLCQQFPTWYKGKQFCFTLARQNATTLKWVRDDGYSGTATILG
ncbi:MAG: hypothetical protein ACRCT6_13270 [Notoacmeibacter sp.]